MAPLQTWREIRFDGKGLQELRRCFEIPSAVFREYSKHFVAAELAWFVGGASNDGLHLDETRGFHPLFWEWGGYNAEMEKALTRLLFDVATVLDRAFGGSTMLLHVSGTMRPNAPLRPEYMKTSVYLPPIIIRDIPDWEQLRIIQMSQEFLEVVGTRTVTRFQNGVRNWNYRNGSEAPARPNMHPCCLPKPAVGSACYVIPGYAVEDSQMNDGDELAVRSGGQTSKINSK